MMVSESAYLSREMNFAPKTSLVVNNQVHLLEAEYRNSTKGKDAHGMAGTKTVKLRLEKHG